MGWHGDWTLGDYELRLTFSRTGSFHRRAGRAPTGRDIVRLGGRHVRITLRHHNWNDLSESEQWDRIHGYNR
jgi:hypothetical protein